MENIFYRQRGNGPSVILLHGFPFHSQIWDDFAEKLSGNFKVYTPDLPGFGNSPIIKSPFSIEQVADRVIGWIEKNQIINSVLIGHSLGGYVALAIAEKRPEMILGLGLFHSTAYADSEEKKASRNKVLEFVDKNGVQAFTSNFISPLFFDQQHPAIATVKALAMQASAEAVKGYTQAMRDRSDKTDVLRKFQGKILFLAGAKDPGISVESIHKQTAISREAETHILPDVAHMGMFENQLQTLKIVSTFIGKHKLPVIE